MESLDSLNKLTVTKSLRESEFKHAEVRTSYELYTCSFLDTLETMTVTFNDESLSFDEMYEHSTALCEILRGNFKNLKYVILNIFDIGERQALGALLPHLHSLKGLYINQCAEVKYLEDEIEGIDMIEVAESELSEMTQLEELQHISYDRNGLRFGIIEHEISGDCVFSNVKKLCIDMLSAYSNSLAQVVKAFPALEHFTINQPFELSQLKELSQMNSVKSLRLHKAFEQPVGVRKQLEVFPNLVALDLITSSLITTQESNPRTISDDDIGAIVSACQNLWF